MGDRGKEKDKDKDKEKRKKHERRRKKERKGRAKISVRNWPLWAGCWKTFRRRREAKRGRRRRRRPLHPTQMSLPRIWTSTLIERPKEQGDLSMISIPYNIIP